MISGRQALAIVEQTIDRARGEEVRLDAALQSATDEAARLRAERMEAFRNLARLKLDALARGEIDTRVDAIERRAVELLERRKRALQELSDSRQHHAQVVQRAQSARHSRAAELEEALSELQDVRSRVEAEVRVSSSWASQRTRVEELARTAEQAEKKATQAEADREEKRKPYEADPLFTYLWRRHFGTSAYRGRGLTRFFDRRVAALVGYDRARANYALLNEIPVRLRAHADRVMQDLAREKTRLKEIEKAALTAAGNDTVQARVAEAKAKLDSAEGTLAKASQALAQIERQHDRAAEDDALYRDAVELLAKSDAAQDLQALYQAAIRTSDPKDESIIKRIETLEAGIGRAEAELGNIRREKKELAARRRQIERERDEFRRRGYDNPFGTFGNERVLATVLGGVLGGILQGTVLRDVLNQGYHRSPTPWDTDFGRQQPPLPMPGGPGDFEWGSGGIGGGGDQEFRSGGSF